MKGMYEVYEREARKQLALTYLDAVKNYVSKFDAWIVEGQAINGYEFSAVETAIEIANTYGFEIPQELHNRARALYIAEGCSTERFDLILEDRPSLTRQSSAS